MSRNSGKKTLHKQSKRKHMSIYCKIFKETNDGPEKLENEINTYLEFSDYQNIKIISVNTTTEKVDGIDYMNVIVFYEKET